MQTIQKCFTELRSHKENTKKEGTQTLWVDVNDLDFKLAILQQRKNCRESVPVLNQVKNNGGQFNKFKGNSSEKCSALTFKKKMSFNSHGQLVNAAQMIEREKIQKPQQIYYQQSRRPFTQNKDRSDTINLSQNQSQKTQNTENAYLEIPQKLLFKKQKINNIKVSMQNSPRQKPANIKFNESKKFGFDTPSNKQNNQNLCSSQKLPSEQFSKKQIENKLQAIKAKINGLTFKTKTENQKKITHNGQNNEKSQLQNAKSPNQRKQTKNTNSNSAKIVHGHIKNKSSNHISYKNIPKKLQTDAVLNPHKSQISLKQQDLQLTQSIMNRYMQAYGGNKLKSQKIQQLFTQLRTIINDS